MDTTLEKNIELKIPEWLPVVPLNNAVLFPGATAPVAVTSDEASRAVEAAAKSNRLFAAISLRTELDEDEEIQGFDHFYNIGTVAFIIRMMRNTEDDAQLVVRGVQKIKVNQFKREDDITYAKVEVVEEERETSKKIEALHRQIVDKAETMIERAPMIPNELRGLPTSVENPHRLAYLVLSLTRADKHRLQNIYEMKNLETKLKETLRELSHELEIIELGGKIQNEIQTRLSKTEREFYLREQLKAIRKELGESEDPNSEIDELREKIDNLQMPLAVKEKAETELNRLARLNPSSPEYPMARNYLDWLMTYPWMEFTEDQLDIKQAKKILNEDHYGLDEIKNRILEFLAVRQLNPKSKGPILCFIGPPGVGKTSLGQSIARALGRKFVRLSLGGVHDEAEIRGHRRTYIGAMPGTIVQHIKRAGTCNPVFMLDEIDKVGQDYRGDPSSALLEVLDPAQNNAFRDHYMELDIDLSNVLFLATANIPDRIQPPLRDRMEEIRLAGYTTMEKEQIALQYLIPRAAVDNGLNKTDIDFGKDVLPYVIQSYTKEAGVRNLERIVNKLGRKIAVQKLEKKWRKKKLTKKTVQDFLGPETFQEEVMRRTSRSGVATGLAWTPVGGEILFVEALAIAGSKGVVLTGKLGDVMKESAKAAFSLVRSQKEKLGIENGFFHEHELHLHVPAGAVPKDGPSAGITIATAVASAATNQPIRKELGMTGEVTLSGLVLPVGGIKEKILGAHRAGIREIIMPAKNEKDLIEVDESIKNEMKFYFVDNVEQVFEISFSKNKMAKSATVSKKKPQKRANSQTKSASN